MLFTLKHLLFLFFALFFLVACGKSESDEILTASSETVSEKTELTPPFRPIPKDGEIPKNGEQLFYDLYAENTKRLFSLFGMEKDAFVLDSIFERQTRIEAEFSLPTQTTEGVFTFLGTSKTDFSDEKNPKWSSENILRFSVKNTFTTIDKGNIIVAAAADKTRGVAQIRTATFHFSRAPDIVKKIQPFLGKWYGIDFPKNGPNPMLSFFGLRTLMAKVFRIDNASEKIFVQEVLPSKNGRYIFLTKETLSEIFLLVFRDAFGRPLGSKMETNMRSEMENENTIFSFSAEDPFLYTTETMRKKGSISSVNLKGEMTPEKYVVDLEGFGVKIYFEYFWKEKKHPFSFSWKMTDPNIAVMLSGEHEKSRVSGTFSLVFPQQGIVKNTNTFAFEKDETGALSGIMKVFFLESEKPTVTITIEKLFFEKGHFVLRLSATSPFIVVKHFLLETRTKALKGLDITLPEAEESITKTIPFLFGLDEWKKFFEHQ